MSTRYLHRSVAEKCPVHTAIKNLCIERIVKDSFFNKEEVVKAARFAAVSESIRWDYVRSFIEEDEGVALIPITSRFFKWKPTKSELNEHGTIVDGRLKLPKNDAVIKIPEKFIAGGNGRRTAGYMKADSVHPTITLAKMHNRRGVRNGVSEAFDNYLIAVKNRVALEGGENAMDTLEKLTDEVAEA